MFSGNLGHPHLGLRSASPRAPSDKIHHLTLETLTSEFLGNFPDFLKRTDLVTDIRDMSLHLIFVESIKTHKQIKIKTWNKNSKLGNLTKYKQDNQDKYIILFKIVQFHQHDVDFFWRRDRNTGIEIQHLKIGFQSRFRFQSLRARARSDKRNLDAERKPECGCPYWSKLSLVLVQ